MKFYDFYSMTAPVDILIATVLAYAITSNNDILYFIVGYLTNFVFNIILKWLFYGLFGGNCFIYRPLDGPKAGCGLYPNKSEDSTCVEVAFPSTNAQTVGFFLGFFFAYILISSVDIVKQVIGLTILLFYCVFVSFNQVFRRCVKYWQYFISFILGILLGIGWFILLDKTNIILVN
jgi:hypothetical protein